ncbi:hypothetical protein ACM66B_003706 [Microbotryomycetes sp. NB124-2]
MGLFGIGRNTTFNATVTVHELSQVPLVTAKFRVKWKFKGATTSGGGNSGAGAASGALHHPHGTGTGSSSKDDSDSDAPDQLASTVTGTARRLLHPATFGNRHSSGEHGSTSSSLRRSLSPLVTSTQDSTAADEYDKYSQAQHHQDSSTAERTPNPNKTPSATHSSTFAFTSPFGSGSDTVYSPVHSSANPSPAQGNTPDDSPASNNNRRRGGADLSRMPPPQAVHNSRAEPKGATSLIPLRNHTVTFQRQVHCPVSIPVKAVSGGTTTRYQLQSSVVKLSVRQEVVGDDGTKQETKAGDVLLDLSQFAQPTTSKRTEPRARRYLLKDSKTNATLRVTVAMEYLSGEADFVAPPLRSGQVNSGTRSGVASSASSSFSKSSTSLVSKGKQSRPKSSSSSVSMSRTTSSSSMSITSDRSSHSSSRASNKPKGWHPTPGIAGQPYSNSPSPGLLGGSNEHGRGAADIIDTIFNQGPRRQGSWDSRPATPSRTRTDQSNNSTLGGDAMVFSLGGHGSSSSTGPRAPIDSFAKMKTSSRAHGLRHASSPITSSLSSSRGGAETLGFRTISGLKSTDDSQASSRSSSIRFNNDSSASTSPDSRPTFARRASLSSSSQSSSSRNLSVRWTDETRPITARTSASALRDEYQLQSRTNEEFGLSRLDVREDGQSAASPTVNRKDFATGQTAAASDDDYDDEDEDESVERHPPPLMDRRLTLRPSANSLRSQQQQQQYHQSPVSVSPSSRNTPKPTPVTPKGQVEWAKSWG